MSHQEMISLKIIKNQNRSYQKTITLKTIKKYIVILRGDYPQKIKNKSCPIMFNFFFYFSLIF
jgi:hypothetical protein